jgi:hypothetical protein
MALTESDFRYFLFCGSQSKLNNLFIWAKQIIVKVLKSVEELPDKIWPVILVGLLKAKNAA